MDPFRTWHRFVELQTKAVMSAVIALASVGPALAYELERDRRFDQARAKPETSCGCDRTSTHCTRASCPRGLPAPVFESAR
jgi:hypothetical protein